MVHIGLSFKWQKKEHRTEECERLSKLLFLFFYQNFIEQTFIIMAYFFRSKKQSCQEFLSEIKIVHSILLTKIKGSF